MVLQIIRITMGIRGMGAERCNGRIAPTIAPGGHKMANYGL